MWEMKRQDGRDPLGTETKHGRETTLIDSGCKGASGLVIDHVALRSNRDVARAPLGIEQRRLLGGELHDDCFQGDLVEPAVVELRDEQRARGRTPDRAA